MARKKKKKGKRIVALLLLLCVVGVTAWAWSIWARIYDNPPQDDDYVRDENIKDEPDKDITNIMILGVDQRTNEPARADTIIIVSINNDTDEVAMISIPRDSRVEIPGRGLDKINHAMAYGGINLMRATIEKLLGVPMHHYVYTNFAGFENIVDSIGGVNLNVERTITAGGVTLQPGSQTLSGKEALAYVRFRNDSEGDFGRMRRQQNFLKAVAKELMQSSSLTKLPKVSEQVSRYVRTDMPITQLLSFGRRLTSLDLDEIAAIQLKGTPINVSGVSYVNLDQEFLNETKNNFLRWQ